MCYASRLILACLVGAIACSGDGGAARDTGAARGAPPTDTLAPDEGGSTTGATPGGAYLRVAAIQVGAFADSGNAARLAGGLRDAGAAAYVSPVAAGGANDRPLWRVRVAVASPERTDLGNLLLLTRHALAARGQALDDSVPASLVAPVRLVWVNRDGTHGMASQVRWVFSPDRTKLVVVEDPVSVENEPVPDGWAYAAESGMPISITGERSWDVAPSPDWRQLIAGVGFYASAGERDSLGSRQWDSLARVSGLPRDETRRSAWEGSGMAIAKDVGRAAIWRLDAPASPVRAPVGGGWQVGWTSNGRAVIGTGPTRAQEDAESPSWIVADPATLAPRDTVRGRSPAVPVRWTTGPMIDIGTPIDVRAAKTIPVAGGAVEGKGGWISLRQGATRRAIGPGVPLAASRNGRLVIAIVSDPTPRRSEIPLQVVVYRVE